MNPNTTNDRNKYQVNEKYWVVSEVKASLIEVYNNFLKAQDNYIKSIKGIIDPVENKAHYISALYCLYAMMLNGFLGYLSREENTEFSEEDYINLAIEDEQDQNKILKMGYILQKWSFTEGPFRITHQEKQYNDIIDQLIEEDEM